MNGPTRILSCLGVVLLIAAGLSASTAWAQNYASPNGKDVDPAFASSCDDFADPCNLASAVREVILDGSGSTVNVISPNNGATMTRERRPAGRA